MVILIAVALYLFMPSSESTKNKEVVKTIAVLPFVNMSSDPNQEYFSEGLSEELLNALARNPKLRVTSRKSSFSFKGKDVDIKTIAVKLNVKHILEGSVRKSGNTLRITTQLIDVETDAHLWSNAYDGTLENIFALQDSISRSIAKALDITLLGKQTASKQMKTDPEVYNAYLLGNHFYNLHTNENLEKAVGYYQKALSIDPSYAPAWVGLSKTHSHQGDAGFVSTDESYRKARQEVEKALELDQNLAIAHSQMGWVKSTYDWDWSGADESYKRALELEPGNEGIIRNTAVLMATLGRFEEAIKLNRRLIEVNPVSVTGYLGIGGNTYYLGLLDESESAYRKILELRPKFPVPHMLICLVYLDKGKPDSALVEVMKVAAPDLKMYGLALVYHALGKKKEADNTLTRYIKENQGRSAYQIAEIYAYRGERDNAFQWLERAYKQRDGGLASIKGDPLLRSIEKDQRYATLMNKMKLPL
jgi:TolB-like protein